MEEIYTETMIRARKDEEGRKKMRGRDELGGEKEGSDLIHGESDLFFLTDEWNESRFRPPKFSVSLPTVHIRRYVEIVGK